MMFGEQETALALVWHVGRKRGNSRSLWPPLPSFPKTWGPHSYRFTIKDFMWQISGFSPALPP